MTEHPTKESGATRAWATMDGFAATVRITVDDRTSIRLGLDEATELLGQLETAVSEAGKLDEDLDRSYPE